jgi:hypothetical protein
MSKLRVPHVETNILPVDIELVVGMDLVATTGGHVWVVSTAVAWVEG